jgi:hypothetical protein
MSSLSRLWRQDRDSRSYTGQPAATRRDRAPKPAPTTEDSQSVSGERRSRPVGGKPLRDAAVVIGIAVAMACLLAVSYTLALGRPTPRRIPAGVVGDPARHKGLISALETQTHGALGLRRYPTAAAAGRAVSEQQIYGVLVLTRPRAELLVASAAGISVARLLERAAATISTPAAEQLTVADLRPLPMSDPEGLASFYVALAATILGFITMLQIRVNASGLSLRAWLLCIVAVAMLGGLMLALVSDSVIAALHGPFPELWTALAAQIATGALFGSTMIMLVGRWAMVPTWAFLVPLGNAASGGAVAPPLLPPFYAFVGRYMPNGATVEIVRNAVYFRHYQHLGPILVEAAWIATTFTALIIIARIKGRGPGMAEA